MISSNDKNGLTDVGVHIGGSRKDLRRTLLRQEDVAAMSEAERKLYLTKARIWPTPDWAAMQKDGVDNKVAAIIYAVRSALHTDASIGHRFEPATAAAYAKLVIGLRNECATWRTLSDVDAFTQTLSDGGHELSELFSLASPKAEQVTWQHDGYEQVIWNPRVMFSTPTMQRWASYFSPEGKVLPESEPRLSQRVLDSVITILRRSSFYYDLPRDERETKGGDFYAYQAYQKAARSSSRKKSTEKEQLSPEEQYQQELKAYRKAVTMPTDEDKKIKSKNLSDWRGGWDVDAETFRAAFGFAGVEFGEYVSTGRRQDMVNAAYDALSDLASVLQMPRVMISLPINQEKQIHPALSAAFGARGSGGARNPMAHYESLRHVFNLTRDRGLGAIAHEWGHALDMSLGESLCFLSDRRGAGPQFGDMAPVLQDKMRAVMDAIKHRSDLSIEEIYSEVEQKAYRSMLGFLSWGDIFYPSYEQAKLEPDLMNQRLDAFYTSLKEALLKTLPEHADLPNWRQGYRYKEVDNLSRSSLNSVVRAVLIPYRRQAAAEGYKRLGSLTGSRLEKSAIWLTELIPQFEAREELKNNLSTDVANQIQVSLKIFKNTQFYRNACTLDGASKTPYWSSRIELFARAFESYIWDKLAAQNKVAPALSLFSNPDRVLPFKNMPSAFPEGKEREAINQCLDELMNAVRLAYQHKGYDIGDVPRPQGIQTDTSILNVVNHKQAMDLADHIDTQHVLLSEVAAVKPWHPKSINFTQDDQLSFDF